MKYPGQGQGIHLNIYPGSSRVKKMGQITHTIKKGVKNDVKIANPKIFSLCVLNTCNRVFNVCKRTG